MIFPRIKRLRFFTVIMTVSVLITLTVAITIMLSTISMSEEFFLRTHTLQNTHIIEQIRRNLDSFHHQVVMTMFQIQQSSAIENVFLLEHAPLEWWERLFVLNGTMDDIAANMGGHDISITLAGEYFVFSTNTSHWHINENELMMDTTQSPRNIVYLHNMQQVGGVDVPFIIIAQSLTNRGIHYANGLIAIRNSDLADLFTAHTRDGNHMFLVDYSGQVLSSDLYQYIGYIVPEFAQVILNYSPETLYYDMQVNSRAQIIMAEYLPVQGLYLLNMIDRQMVVYGIIDTATILWIVIVIVVVSVGIMWIVYGSITKCLTRLSQEINQVSHQEFKEHVTTSGYHEVQEITLAFNSMLDKLNVHIDELVRVSQQKREAELTGLQRQINIHFIYNTLTSIKLLIADQKYAEATETIFDLISLLQFTVGDTSETTTIASEVSHLRNYLRIMQRRYGQDILVNFYIDQDTLCTQIPKLIIQPFIENSFIHAFGNMQSGNIDLFIWQEDGQVVCEIIDNGEGFQAESKVGQNGKQHFSGLGIKNVNERIHLLYGEGFGATVRSHPIEGSKVTIRLPRSDFPVVNE